MASENSFRTEPGVLGQALPLSGPDAGEPALAADAHGGGPPGRPFGAGAARLLGSLLLAQLWHHLLSRQALVPERRHIISVFIDEVHDFLAGLPDDLSDALAQSRSLGAAFHLAHQYRAQLSPQMIQAIETNARNKIYFNLSGTDAAASELFL